MSAKPIGKGHGNRIVKPLTVKQRKAVLEYSENPGHQIGIIPAHVGLPDRSWWAGLSDEQFQEIAKVEAKRMQHSRVAHGLTLRE